MGAREFLRTVAPNFCWVTAYDLFLMYEQINEDCPQHSFKSQLCQLTKQGVFITKPFKKMHSNETIQGKKYLYLRVI